MFLLGRSKGKSATGCGVVLLSEGWIISTKGLACGHVEIETESTSWGRKKILARKMVGENYYLRETCACERLCLLLYEGAGPSIMKHILLGDDHEMARLALKHFLGTMGMSVEGFVTLTSCGHPGKGFLFPFMRTPMPSTRETISNARSCS